MAHEDAHVPSESENLEYLKSELKKRGYPPLLEHKEEKEIREPTVAILGYIDCISSPKLTNTFKSSSSLKEELLLQEILSSALNQIGFKVRLLVTKPTFIKYL